MAEELTLTTPIPHPSIVSYKVVRIDMDMRSRYILIVVVGTDNSVISATYTDDTAVLLMQQLNKLNLSIKSLQARVLERLVLDGKLPAGAVTGTPD